MQVVPHPDFMVFTGNANPALAAEIAGHLGISLGAASVGRFSDGEVTVEINTNVRARDVFVVQSTCAPTNENLMELLIMVDALKRASAERISAVIPYFGYARQDRRPRSSRVPISAKVVANLLQVVAEHIHTLGEERLGGDAVGFGPILRMCYEVGLILLQLGLFQVHDALLEAQPGNAVGRLGELALKIGKRLLIPQLARVLQRDEITLYGFLSSRCHRSAFLVLTLTACAGRFLESLAA
jgi:hypothetical protein